MTLEERRVLRNLIDASGWETHYTMHPAARAALDDPCLAVRVARSELGDFTVDVFAEVLTARFREHAPVLLELLRGLHYDSKAELVYFPEAR